MSSLSMPSTHRPRRQRSALRLTVFVAESLLLGLAFAFQGAVALDQALSTPIIAPHMAPLAYPVPTVAMKQSRQAANTTFADCIAAMDSSDSNDNSFLSQNEYMSFVNILSDDAFQGQGLANVSTPIKKNFWTLAGNNTNGIDVSGSNDSSPSDAETANLQNICESTTAAINAALAPIAAPSQAPVPADGLDRSTESCFEAMKTADTNGDSMLNQNEYVTFVDISSDGEISVSSFGELPQPFRQNFWQWSNNTNQIDIFGSKQGQNASTEQMDFLKMMCNETDALLSPTPPPAPSSVAPVDEPSSSPSTPAPPTAPSSVAPVDEPSSSPSTPAPMTAPSSVAPVDVPTSSPLTPAPTTAGTSVTIKSEFIIYNTNDLDANATKNTSAFEDLTLAYSNLAQEIVGTLSTIRRKKQNVLRNPSDQRRLVVDFIDNSAEITSMIDTQCPPGTPSNAFCQMALASYRVSVVDENDDAVSELYTNVTQTAIDEGGLQTQLAAVNPNSGITIAEPSALPTMAPTGPPTLPPSDGDGLSTGAIVGIAVSGTVVVLGAGLALFYARKSNIPKRKPVGDSSVDGGGNYDEYAQQEKRPSRFGDNIAAGTMPTAPMTADDFDKYTEDDYSYQSGSFYENENQHSGSTFETETVITSKLEDYKFDSPSEVKKDAARMKANPLVLDTSSSSNAGSSGWSSSEEDTDNDADDEQDRPQNKSSGDSFFNPKARSIKSKEEPGGVSTSGSASTSGSESSGSKSTSGSTSTSGSASTSESEQSGPQHYDSGFTGSYSPRSYADESAFSEVYKRT